MRHWQAASLTRTRSASAAAAAGTRSLACRSHCSPRACRLLNGLSTVTVTVAAPLTRNLLTLAIWGHFRLGMETIACLSCANHVAKWSEFWTAEAGHGANDHVPALRLQRLALQPRVSMLLRYKDLLRLSARLHCDSASRATRKLIESFKIYKNGILCTHCQATCRESPESF